MARSLCATLACALLLTGCTRTVRMVGFVQTPSALAKIDGVPFQKAWFDAHSSLSSYRRIRIAPVSLKHLAWLHSAGEEDAENLKGLAHHTEQVLADAFRNTIRFNVVDASQPADLVLELAITEVDPSIPALEVAGLFVWGVQLFNFVSVAFEAQMRDTKTGNVVAAFADRETPPFEIIGDFGKFYRYRPAERTLLEWAKQLAEVADAVPGERIADIIPVGVVNW